MSEAQAAAGFAQYIDGKYGLAGLVAMGVFGFLAWRIYSDGKKSPPKDAGQAANALITEIRGLKETQADHGKRLTQNEILTARIDERTKRE